MKLEIVTPSKQVLSDEADQVYAVGPKGEFGILPGHAHYVTPLGTGTLHLTQAGQTKTFMVSGGFLEVLQEQVFVLADRVESAEEINLSENQNRLAELEKKLGTDIFEAEEFQNLLAERDLAQARINAVS